MDTQERCSLKRSGHSIREVRLYAYHSPIDFEYAPDSCPEAFAARLQPVMKKSINQGKILLCKAYYMLQTKNNIKFTFHVSACMTILVLRACDLHLFYSL